MSKSTILFGTLWILGSLTLPSFFIFFVFADCVEKQEQYSNEYKNIIETKMAGLSVVKRKYVFEAATDTLRLRRVYPNPISGSYAYETLYFQIISMYKQHGSFDKMLEVQFPDKPWETKYVLEFD